MQVVVENTGGLGRRMRVEVPAGQLHERIEKQVREYARSVNIKGFRRGKVPPMVVEQRFGAQIRNEASSELIRETLNRALDQEGLKPATPPSVATEGSAEQFAYTATFDVLPDFGEIDVSDLSFEREVAEVTEEDIDRMIDNLRRQRVQFNAVERAAADTDMVAFEYHVQAEDFRDPLEGVERGATILGQGAIFNELEAALYEKSPGEELTVEVNFPVGYRDSRLAGKAATVHAKVIKVSEAELPEVDADFIRSFGISDGELATFRSEIRSNLDRELAQALSARLRAKVIDLLLDRHADVEVPGSMVEQEAKSLQSANHRQAMQQARGQGTPEPKPVENFTDTAKRRVRAGLLLSEIASRQSLVLDRGRVEAALAQIASTYEDPAEVISAYRQSAELMRAVQSRVMEEQVAEWIASQAKVSDVQRGFQEVVAPNAGAAA